MYQKIKKTFYFPIAWYFRFFAEIKLRRWHPKVIVVTGSSGKTTLFNLIESQLGNKAFYSHEANSSFGIPFNILGIHRKDLTILEWPKIFILPWFKVFSSNPKEKVYVVEADCDRPYEGIFLGTLLKPDITLWTNVSRTHVINFSGGEDSIAQEFGNLVERTKSLVIFNNESKLINKNIYRIKCKTVGISLSEELLNYDVTLTGTRYKFRKFEINLQFLLPKEVGRSILMCFELLENLNIEPDLNFKNFKLAPGRNSLFKGIKNITIVDSAYNANLSSMTEIINMFGQIKADKKWVVLGDMLELGIFEKEEHEKLAEVILKYKFNKIVLMGPRVTKYTSPLIPDSIHFMSPKEVLDNLRANITGGEVILFKGARFLEGVIENLLADKEDKKYLDRREKIWEIRRKKWGL